MLFSVHCRPSSSQFRCRFRWVAPAMSALIRCCATRRPSVILTTSAVGGQCRRICQVAVRRNRAHRSSRSILLDLDAPRGSRRRGANTTPTRRICNTRPGRPVQPAGVMVSNRNVLANFKQLMSDYTSRTTARLLPPDTTVVSWLPFYHDMGLMVGICIPVLAWASRCAHESDVVPAAAGPVDAVAGKQFSRVLSGPELRFRTGGAKNIGRRHGRARSGDVLVIINGSERVQPATLRALLRAVRALQSCTTWRYDRHMEWQKQRCTWRPAHR